MTHCLPICRRRRQKRREKEARKVEKDEDEKTLKKLVANEQVLHVPCLILSEQTHQN